MEAAPVCGRLRPDECAPSLLDLPDDVLARVLSHAPLRVGLAINRRCRHLATGQLRSICPVSDHPGALVSGSLGVIAQHIDPLDPHNRDESLRGMLPLLAAAPRLHTVRLLHLTSRPNVQVLAQLPRVRDVELGSIGPAHLPALAQLVHVTALAVSNCRGVATLDFTGGMSSLCELTLSHAHSLESFAGLASAPMLRALRLRSLWQTIPSLASLETCTALQHLAISCLPGCRQLSDMSPLAALAELTHLTVQNAPNVSGIEAVQQLTALRELCLQELGDGLHPVLPSLTQLTHLTSLTVAWCRPASSLRVLRSLQALRRLDVSKWPFPTNADSLCALKNLTTLRLCDMYGLRLGPLLGGLTDLQHLTLLECGTAPLSSLRWASSLQTLRSLHVDVRGPLEGMTGLLSSADTLEHLHITNCHNTLACRAAIGALTRLTHLLLSSPKAMSNVVQAA